MVTGVPTADTLDVLLASGKRERIHVAGVRAPAAGACYAGEATAGARELALAKRVVLLREAAGRYVTTSGGADLGRLLLSRGLAQIDVWNRPFARFPAYVPVQRRAEEANVGMWGACAADVAVTLGVTPNPVSIGGRLTYTVAVSNRGPLAAPRVELELRPPAGVELLSAQSPDGACAAESWLGTCAFSALAADGTATATFLAEVTTAGAISTRAAIRLAGCIRASCGAAPLHDANLRNDETAALVTARDATSSTPGSSPPPAGGCHPSYPDTCIPPPPPDLDCADIPYRDFYVRRDPPDADPHILDGNEDGVGCQFDDY